MQKILLEDTIIYISPISADSSISHRELEKQAIREIIAEVCGPECMLCHDAQGAPYLCNDDKPMAVHISISHSAKIACVAFNSTTRIGVDIENIRPQLRRVASRFLNAEELSFIKTDFDLLKAWTVKEATFKAAGREKLTLNEINFQFDQDTAVVYPDFFRLLYFHPADDTLLTLAIKK